MVQAFTNVCPVRLSWIEENVLLRDRLDCVGILCPLTDGRIPAYDTEGHRFESCRSSVCLLPNVFVIKLMIRQSWHLWRLYGGHSQDNTLCRTYRLFLVSAVEPFLLPPSSTTLRQVELNATPMHRSIGNNTHRRKSWWTASVERLPTACMERGMCEIQWIDTTLTLLHSYSCFS